MVKPRGTHGSAEATVAEAMVVEAMVVEATVVEETTNRTSLKG